MMVSDGQEEALPPDHCSAQAGSMEGGGQTHQVNVKVPGQPTHRVSKCCTPVKALTSPPALICIPHSLLKLSQMHGHRCRFDML